MAHILAPEAEAELDDIWHYIAKGSGNPEIADRFIDRLTEHFYLLAVTPYIGRRRDDLRAGFAMNDYLILYRIEEEDVRILDVVQGSRNIQELFGY